MYSLVEFGCQQKEDALEIASTYADKGQSEAWRLIRAKAKHVDVAIEDGAVRHLSVVNAHTAMGNFYWLLMLSAHFVID